MAIIKNKKTIRRLCLEAGVVVLLCMAAAVLLLPRFINKEMVREKIVYLLSEKISGTVDFQAANVSLFPLPHVIIRNASLNIPDKVIGTIGTLTVYPELIPLFHGEVRLSKMRINGPSFTFRIPAKMDEKTKSLEKIAALLRSLALGSADISISVDNGSIKLEKSGRPPVYVKEIGLSLKLASTKDGVELTLDKLSSKEPGLSISAVFRVKPSAKIISLEAEGKSMDVSPVRKAALDLAGDVQVVQRIFTFLRGGNVEQIAFQSKGNSFEDLGGTANINIQGNLTKGEIFVPGPGLAFREVKGECVIANGILKASEMTGVIGKSRVKEGALSVGLKGADALFHLDAAVSADLTDVNIILRNVVKNRDFLEELGHVRSIKGRAEGRLVLGESLARIIPRIDIKDMGFTSEYDRVPYPLEIKKGRFSYDEKGVAVKSLEGTAGRSSFSGLDGQLRTGAKTRLTILSGKAGLDIAEMHRWLSSYEKLKAPLSKIASLSGRLNISSLTFQGLVIDQQDWKFKLAGSAEKLLINSSLLPAALSLKNGKFEAQAGRLFFSGDGANFLDASSVISGSVDASIDNVRKGDIQFTGTVGPKALQWIKSAFSIPEYVRTDQPIAVSGGRLTWQEKGAIAFGGNLKTASGQSVALDLSKGQDSLLIRKLEVEDAVSRALFSLDLREKKIRAGFKGRLDASTAVSLITTPKMQGGLVQGEITAEFNEGDVAGVIAQGRLRGEKIVLPWKKDMQLRIDSLDMSAEKGSFSLGSVRLRLGTNAISLKGNIVSKADGLLVDIDVSSDRIIWDDLVKDVDRTEDREPSEKKKEARPVQGLVRLKSDIFEYEGIQVAPLTADIVLSAEKTDLRILKARPCSIGMTGGISLSPDGAERKIELDLRFEATDQELKPTILCLSKGKSDATGLFTFKGHIKGRGKAEDLKKVVEGNIELTAKKGSIYRYKTLDSVFDFLDKEEEFRGQMPDLDKSQLSYERLKVTAAVGKGSLVVKEAIIDSALIGVVAQGSLNLMDNRLNLNVMVAPIRQVNRLIGRTPIIGALFGGSAISVPVKVTGTTADPKVTYLSPSAVASSLVGLMKRTLKLPVSILSPLFPRDKQK